MKINDKFCLVPNIESRNRIVLAPMDVNSSVDGFVNDIHIQHYGSRAYGGVGTIIVEGTGITPDGRYTDKSLGIWKDEHIEGLQRLVNIVHTGGSVIGIQVFHGGSKSQITDQKRGINHYFDFLDQNNLKIIDLKEFYEICDEFVNSARRAKKAGFDFIEIHLGDGILLSNLLINELNTLTISENIQEKIEPIIYILKNIQEKIAIPVGVRISVNDSNPDGIKVEDYKEIIPLIEPYISYIHVSAGDILSKRKSTIGVENNVKLHRLEYSKKLKEYTNLNIITTGNYGSKEDILEALKNNINAVSVGRCLIANPSFVMTNLLENQEIDDRYHWNNNPWYKHQHFIK
ncbi:NADH:flavin oxidoreductase/NADH oxidase [Spiroplasma diminutum]|uniref:NADH:flavin oxidoreductase/NADH oxidase n=1 Tax=Spiroplasma diminutum CUAS-1 TaxID=1276221 RepID=S5MJU1_9MOLU|nr:NADH:flavin oxidoreductase/NADH oxidase [Spiroplasma diminutum]AGR42220.1 NADH:flavin oxidoreductase/NADH oxidase [Spiroplasma diminutum CUAS-1]